MAEDARAEAALKLTEIIVRERTTDQVFGSSPSVAPLVGELVFGTLRHYPSLAAVVRKQLQKPLKINDMDIFHLLMIGLYQRHFTRIPDHAAVNETVAATRQLKKPWARGLVNAILRRAPSPEPSFEHPDWFPKALGLGLQSHAAEIMTANNARAPMALRVNLGKISVVDFVAQLEGAAMVGHSAGPEHDQTSSWGPETLILEAPVPSRLLPGFKEGLVSIQDAGAQLLPAVMLSGGVQPQGTLLDACAAPGGKLFHLLERFHDLDITAIDRSARRMETLLLESRRLGTRPFKSLVADALSDDWWDEAPYDHILLDAPCSGSGTIRRHPEIKLLRRKESLPAYAASQLGLLKRLWPKLKQGGSLIYCTCSLFEIENDAVIESFLLETPNASPGALHLSSGTATRFGWQLVPTDPRTDGFYFSRLTKVDA